MSGPTHLRDDLEMAAGISVAGCDTCRCGSMGIRLHDADGRIFAAVRLTPDVAAAFLDQVRIKIEQSTAGGLGAIRCEGSA